MPIFQTCIRSLQKIVTKSYEIVFVFLCFLINDKIMKWVQKKDKAIQGGAQIKLLVMNKAENADFQSYAAGKAILQCLEILKNAVHYCTSPSTANAEQC